MARTPSAKDYPVHVPGIGAFMFSRRGIEDEIAVQVGYSRRIKGVEPSEWLTLLATWISTLEVLTVDAPAGWDLQALDPLEQEDIDKLFKVYTALREKEGSFRRRPQVASEAGGTGAGQDAGVLVSEKVQPAA